MTRINLVEPNQLTDKHLMAEYHELPRVFTKVIRRMEKGQTLIDVDIPESYRMGEGHETFFFDKCHFLMQRLHSIFQELHYREVNLDHLKYQEVYARYMKNIHLTEWAGDYKPTPEDIYLNMARLVQRCKIPSVQFELASD